MLLRAGDGGMRSLWVALLPLLLQSATGQQNPWDISDGPIVAYRYRDLNCTQRLTSGEWMQQSWQKIEHGPGIEGSSYCYDITQGPLCDIAPCFIKLSCAYESGSGIVYQKMGNRQCTGEPISPLMAVAPDMTWLGVVGYFTQGKCSVYRSTPSTYISFASPLREAGIGFPDCSSEGDVATVGLNGEAVSNFIDEYTMQYYTDDYCREPYNVTAASTKMVSSYEWKIHRGAQFCYDMVDTTVRSNETSRVADYNRLNIRLSCGNPDGVGNGLLINSGYRDQKCRGTFTTTETWRSALYPMNYPVVKELMDGKCIRWGQLSAKFNKPWNESHYPQCQDFACKSGLCAGGRLLGPGAVIGVYQGSIAQAPSNPAAACSPTAVASWALALLATTLAAGRSESPRRRPP